MWFITNKTEGICRRITHHEREFVVVPVVAVREGVLNGELVLADEIGRYVEAWNGIPVPLRHPTVRGVAVSANTPDIVARCPGRFWNARVVGDKLLGEMWLDVEIVDNLGGEAVSVLQRLEAGEPVEVSTAYWRDVEDAQGEWGGKAYNGIARNLRPDHLALLPDEVGACSWQDGCGAPRLNCGGGVMKVNVLSSARRPSYDGTEEISWADVPRTFTAYRDGFYKHTNTAKPEDVPGNVSGAPAEMKRWIAAKSLLGDPAAETWRDLLFFPVVNPGTNKLNAGAVRAVLGGRAAQADIPEGALESAQAMARQLLEDEFQPQENQEGGSMSRTVTVNYEISLDEKRSRVWDAWRALYEPKDGEERRNPYLYIREVFDDKVIVEGDPKGLLSYPYTMGADGQIVFGAPARVRIVYEPVPEQTGETTGVASKLEEMLAGIMKLLKPNREVEQMNEKDKLIEKLAANAGCPIGREGLAALGLEDLKALEVKLEVGCAGAQTNQDEGEVPPAPLARLSGAATELAAFAEAIKAMGGVDAVIGAMKSVTANTANEHSQLVAELHANERMAFSEDELKAMPLEALRKLADSLRPADYAGRGAGRGGQAPAEAEMAMPDLFA